MSRLEEYKNKRHFDKTPEPAAEIGEAGSVLSFVVQKHAARSLHYDFRLEFEGVLMSWAVPKGPSMDPSVKRLAVHVEDHPLSYGSFEGDIPKGEYGAGHVEIWDSGAWLPLHDVNEMMKKGELKFLLAGEKLQGGFALIKFKSDEDNWLLIKEKDEFAEQEHE